MNALSARRTLVTGASKPLGVELVRQSLMRGDKVYAACRNPARVPILADLRAEFGGLELLALDFADSASVAEAVPVLESLTDSLDLLVVAPADPGTHEKLSDAERDAHLDTLTGTGLTEHYRRYAVAPVLLVRTLLPWLAKGDGARVLMVTSWLGSLAGKTQGGDYATCASAAGLHMLTRALAHDLAEERIVVCLGNPGNYATSPDGPMFRVPIDEAALGLLMQTERLPLARSGAYLDWTGAERAW
ncbi:MAG: SDR family NAD(P)-dependent oxidoreductase [Gemmatimonas sp.]|jgi:NAD(P)-dependent dehydrogenase (short-subunit alcohol dehydrogenase family)|uniref:SDR family NAD(P)-dependent oxidoreductase n=1 Tax=Gemmatimonas sp. TaxID=1962908 RepID=UPI00391F0D7D|nr:SDR family NAD(P)-dependent oxidoreductase [Gemmatimonadota bacterium]